MMRIILSLIILTATINCNAQYRTANIYHFNQELRNYNISYLNNPAFYLYQSDSTYSDIILQLYNSKSSGLYNIQEGSKHTTYTFNAESLQKKDNSTYWGAASYSKQRHNNISWNTATDINKIHPYIVADLVGGNSYEEFYSFKGGYAKHLKSISIGIEGEYRAGISYRKLDPRPQSDISDLIVTAGITTTLGKNILGVNYSYNNYTQEHNISVFRPGSGYPVYYLRGMGISEIRFSTSISDKDAFSNTYKSYSNGLGIQLYPRNHNGLSAALFVTKSKLKLQYNQGIALKVVNQLNYYDLGGEITCRFSSEFRDIRIKLFGSANLKEGFDYNYEQGTFTLLSKPQEKYKNNSYTGGLSVIYQVQLKEHKRFFIKGSSKGSYNKEEYSINITAPPAYQEITNLETSLNFGMNYQFSNSAITIQLHTKYRHNIDSELQTSADAVETANETLVIPNYQYYTVNKLGFLPELRYDYDIKDKYGIYLKAQNNTEIYEQGEPFSSFLIAVGLTL
ncbi:MAG: hypothetical protein N4A71_10625 [Carboxylicivirga sp.]|jgi:hypothetical protein|nr:hypothetical protein [Carboxylicivirga sp.]